MPPVALRGFGLSDEIIVAAILAGGRSSRFGTPKALAEMAGRPLIAHVARALSGAVEISVVGAEAAAQAIGVVRLADPLGAADGPLAGILAALAWGAERGAGWLCVAPCDAPLLPNDLVARLRAAAGDASLACVTTNAGIEPLISIWRTALLAEVRAEMTGGAHPAARDLARQFGAAYLRLDEADIMNVNTREDLARAEASYRTKP
jgi:molybdopterin-guanine dinucleotide biosynthesis protein A